jgi:hypothetical protein
MGMIAMDGSKNRLKVTDSSAGMRLQIMHARRKERKRTRGVQRDCLASSRIKLQKDILIRQAVLWHKLEYLAIRCSIPERAGLLCGFTLGVSLY